ELVLPGRRGGGARARARVERLRRDARVQLEQVLRRVPLRYGSGAAVAAGGGAAHGRDDSLEEVVELIELLRRELLAEDVVDVANHALALGIDGLPRRSDGGVDGARRHL